MFLHPIFLLLSIQISFICVFVTLKVVLNLLLVNLWGGVFFFPLRSKATKEAKLGVISIILVQILFLHVI